MKNKLMHLLLFCIVSGLSASAQKLYYPKLFSITPYQIQVSDKATTIIAFPYSILDADCGIEDLRAEKVGKMPNILKIKAARENINNTSLQVFTADGKFYVFQVSYNPTPPVIAYGIGDQLTSNNVKRFVSHSSNVNEEELNTLITKVRSAPEFLNRKNRKFHMKLGIAGTYIHDDLLFVKFRISNKSNISYYADWTHIYLQDKKIAKRSSAQQLSIEPVYKDSQPHIEGNQDDVWIMVIPMITIPDKKELIFEMQEHNGGRNITISIHNSDIFLAKNL